MKTKTAIRIIDNLNTAGILGIILLFLSFLAKLKGTTVNIPLMVVSLPLICCFFIKNLLLNQFLKKVQYPGIIFTVLTKLNDTATSNIELTDDLLNDVYRPAYDKSKFLDDNNLKTEIGKSKFELPSAAFAFIFSVALFVFVSSTTSFTKEPLFYLGCLGLLIGNTFYFFSEKKRYNDKTPVIRFEDKGIYLQGEFIDWKSIDDWKFVSGGKYRRAKVVLSYRDNRLDMKEATITPEELNADYVDISMLLSFHKAGRKEYTSANIGFVQ
jgi:hypothetical protein